MCTAAALKALIGASSGTVKAAYCNDQYLVVLSNKVCAPAHRKVNPARPQCCVHLSCVRGL